MIEAQSRAVQDVRRTIRDIEVASAIEYRKLLTELSAQQIGRRIEQGTNGIVRDVAQQLTGENGMLVRSALEHATTLEQSRLRFVTAIDSAMVKVVDEAARKTAASTRRGVRYTVFLAMATVVVYAAVMFGRMVFWSAHQSVADVDAAGTCSAAQRSARPPG